MPQVKDIKILNFNDKAYSVEDMSNEIQTLVYHYNNANKQEAELTDKVILLRVARDGILSQIRTQFDAEQKAVADKAAAEKAAADATAQAAAEKAVVVSEASPTVN